LRRIRKNDGERQEDGAFAGDRGEFSIGFLDGKDGEVGEIIKLLGTG
jgi:hypothetical protein